MGDALGRLDECLLKLQELACDTNAAPAQKLVTEFTAALDEDLNISAAWGIVFDWVRDTNKQLAGGQISAAQAAAELDAWRKIDSVFGLGSKTEQSAPRELLALLDQRQAARKTKDFKRADAIRDELKAKGWGIEDTPKGPKVKQSAA